MSGGLETNKIVGAILTALLVTVGISHFGAALFGSGEHGERVMAYPVEGGEHAGPAEPAAPEIVPTVLPLLADADPARGEQLFSACRSCHTPTEGGNNGVGPNLWGVVGKDIATHEGYSYSDALTALEGVWTYDNLNHMIHNPREFAPGTKMTYAGMPPVEDRAAVIAYLRTLSNDPVPLPTQDEIDAAVAEQQAAMGGDGEAEGDGSGNGAAVEGEGEPSDEAATDEETTDEATSGEATSGEATTDEGAAEGTESTQPAETESTDETTAPDESASDEEAAADESTADEPEATESDAGGDEAASPEDSGAAEEATPPAEGTDNAPADDGTEPETEGEGQGG